MAEEIIKRVIVQAESAGLDRLAADLKKIELAGGDVARALRIDDPSKQFLNAEKAVRNAERAYVSGISVLEKYQRVLNAIGRGASTGMDPARLNALADAARKNLFGLTEAEKALEAATKHRAAAQADAQAKLAAYKQEQGQFGPSRTLFDTEQEKRRRAEEAREMMRRANPPTAHIEAFQAHQAELAAKRAADEQDLKDIATATRALEATETRRAQKAIQDELTLHNAREREKRELQEIEAMLQRESTTGWAKNLGLRVNVGAIGAPGAAGTPAEQAAEAQREARAAAAREVRSQVDPRGTLEASINQQKRLYTELKKTGDISEKEFTQAIAMADRQLGNFGKGVGLRSHEIANLGYQLNDVAAGLISGQSPFTILAQQGPQFFQIMQQSKGGFVQGLKDMSASAVTAAKAVGLLGVGIGTFAVAIGTAVASVISFRNAQNEVQRSLNGVGLASGATVGSIEKFAEAMSSSTTMSTREARNLGATFASTGKIGIAQFDDLARSAERLSKVFGTDIAEEGKFLAEAFKDPVRGLDMINARLGGVTSKTEAYVKALREQGDLTGTQIALQKTLDDALKGSIDTVTALGSAWDHTAKYISEAYTNVGKYIDRAMGGGSLEEQIAATRKRIEDMRKQDEATGGWSTRGNAPYLAREQALLDTQLAQQSAAIKKGLDDKNAEIAKQADAVIKNVQVDQTRLQDLVNKRDLMVKALGDESILNQMQMSAEQAEAALEGFNSELKNFRLTAEQVQQDSMLEIKGIEARTLAQRAENEADKAFIQTQRQGVDLAVAGQKAEAARNREIAIANRQAEDYIKSVASESRLVGKRGFERTREELRIQQEENRLRFGRDGYAPTPEGPRTLPAVSATTTQNADRLVSGAAAVAKELGVSTRNILGIISYETKGTFSPTIAGPTTKWGTQRGLIQWGGPQARAAGITDFSNIEQQFAGMVPYFKGAGVRPGTGLAGLYAAVNAGNVNRLGARDAAAGGAPGTVLDKVATMGPHLAKADALMAKSIQVRGQLADIQQKNNDLEIKSAELIQLSNAEKNAQNAVTDSGVRNAEAAEAAVRSLADTYFMSAGQTAYYNEKQRMMNELLNNNIPITQEVTDRVEALARRTGDAAAQTAKLNETQKAISDLAQAGKEFFGGIISDLRQGKDAAEAFQNALDRLADRMLNMALEAAFAPLTSGGKETGGGFGNLLSGLFGFLKGGSGSSGLGTTPGTGGLYHEGGEIGWNGPKSLLPANFWDDPIRMHNGGRVSGSSLRSDEVPIIAQQGEWMLSKDQAARAMRGGGGNNVNVNNTVVNQAGADVETKAAPNSNGGVDILTIVRKQVQDEVLKPGTGTNRGMKTNYGLRQGLTRR